MSSELDQVCRLLDKLTLDTLTLMEEEIQMKLNVERAMCDGETHLAKSRYILGQNKVSALQLPTENSSEFPALMTVHATEEEKLFGEKSFHLELTKKSEMNAHKLQDPVRWFGYLVPQNLNAAQNMYRQALQWILKAINVQTQLIQTCKKVEELRAYKESLKVKLSCDVEEVAS